MRIFEVELQVVADDGKVTEAKLEESIKNALKKIVHVEGIVVREAVEDLEDLERDVEEDDEEGSDY